MKEIKIIRAIIRAIMYEGKARKSKKKMVRKYIKDLEKERPVRGEGNWERRELMEKAKMRKKLQLKDEMEAGAQKICSKRHRGENKEKG